MARKKPLPYDKARLQRNIRILMGAKGVIWKEFGVSYNLIDANRYDQDVKLSLLVKVADRLGVTLDTLVYADLSAELDRVNEETKGRRIYEGINCDSERTESTEELI